IVWGNLGWTLYGMGKYDEALAASRKALELDAKLAYVRFNMGLIYAVQGDWTRAEKEYRDALSAAQTSDIDAAMDDVREAQKKAPSSTVLKQALALLQGATKPQRPGAKA